MNLPRAFARLRPWPWPPSPLSRRWGLTGCNDATRTATQPAGEATSTAPTADTTTADADESPAPATPTQSTTSAAPLPSAPTSSAPAGTGGLRSRLLDAAELPGFNADYRWTEGHPAPASRRGRRPLPALRAAGDRRDRVACPPLPARPTGGTQDRASELVAEFPDSTTARRAFAVLKAWRAQCADRLGGYKTSEVGDLQDVSVAGGTGGWYLLTYGPVAGDPDAPSSTPRAWRWSAPGSRWWRWCWPARTTTTSRARSRWSPPCSGPRTGWAERLGRSDPRALASERVSAASPLDRMWDRGRVSFRARRARLRSKSWHIGQCAVAAGLAWFLAHDVVGHPRPFFAPDRRGRLPRHVLRPAAAPGRRGHHRRGHRRLPRRPAAAADRHRRLAGHGAGRAGDVDTLLLNAGTLFVTQAAVQGIVVVTFAAAPGYALTRWVDALIGGAVALVAAAVVPRAPLRRPRSRPRSSYDASRSCSGRGRERRGRRRRAGACRCSPTRAAPSG